MAWDATTALVVAPKSRASATLRNDTARDLSVSFQISGKFTVNRPEVELTPAEVATIRVTSTDGKTGTATLAAVVKPSEELPLGYVARRDVTIGGAPSAAVEPTAKVRSTWGGGGATKGNLIPLTASDCAKVAVPQTPAGYVLSDDGRRAAVTLACRQLGTRGALEMSFDALANTGAKYTGDVEVGTGTVAVTVDRTMTWPIPVGLLLAGLCMALWLLGRGPKRVVNALKVRLLRAQEAIGNRDSPGTAVTGFRDAAGGARAFSDMSGRAGALLLVAEERERPDGRGGRVLLAWKARARGSGAAVGRSSSQASRRHRTQTWVDRREALPGAQALRVRACVSCPDGAPDPSSSMSWVAGTGLEMW